MPDYNYNINYRNNYHTLYEIHELFNIYGNIAKYYMSIFYSGKKEPNLIMETEWK